MSALSLTFGPTELSIQLLLLPLVWLQPAITVADSFTNTDYFSVTWDRCYELHNKNEPVMFTPIIDNSATALDISRCNLTVLRQSDFDGLPNLKVLYLHLNDLTELESSTFKSVPKLDQLYLDRNKLRELPVFDEQSLNQLTIHTPGRQSAHRNL
ncbi:decorin-like [Leguminivora glycinivorella]|uniref:decorin-like n=1 Tax=Leguminivora glycinivorella TaxID=1035111 RepID=UPI00200F0B6A|nr:decorin-like [Leguminivora glycinivorella]